LDERERGYDRHAIQIPEGETPTAVYAVPEDSWLPHGPDHPILLSYLDVVIAGYLEKFGTQGPQHFFETTQGWDAPVLNDRARPLYPRSKPLGDDVRDLVDGWLDQCRTSVIAS
jgi:hypothetical protein